jgi:hypothetical protein
MGLEMTMRFGRGSSMSERATAVAKQNIFGQIPCLVLAEKRVGCWVLGAGCWVLLTLPLASCYSHSCSMRAIRGMMDQFKLSSCRVVEAPENQV